MKYSLNLWLARHKWANRIVNALGVIWVMFMGGVMGYACAQCL